MTPSRSVTLKLLAALIATALFTLLAVMSAGLLGFPIGQTLVGAAAIGAQVALVEIFYVRARPGRWLREMHPVASLLVYAMIVLGVSLLVMHLNHALFGRLDQLPATYRRLPVTLPLIFGLAVLAITAIRIVGFVGPRNVVDLIIGKYHRPVVEQRLFLFLDIKGSTALVERLGPAGARALIGKFFFDISAPITDHGGDIYRFTGDGVVATWPWNEGVAGDGVIAAIDAIHAAVDGERDRYAARFDAVPAFRIGVHGGDIVVSEEGDTKRAIGFYGDTIHIAARMEQKAKELEVDTLISGDVVDALASSQNRLAEVAREAVRGISRPIGMYALAASAHPPVASNAEHETPQ